MTVENDEQMQEIMKAVNRIGGNMPGGFFIYRADGEEALLYANDVILDIFGCDTLDEFRELTGYTFRGMVYPEDYAGIEKSIDDQVEDSRLNLDYVEYRIVRKDGEIRWVDDYGRLVHSEAFGDVYYVLIRDITEHKRILEEKRLAEFALEREKRMNEIRKDFLFQVSHDIRTPMNAIKGFTDLALLNLDDPEILKKYLLRVDSANTWMIMLINDLLDMSLIDSGKVDFSESVCSLCEVIKKLCIPVEETAREKDIRFTTDISLTDCRVYLDERYFSRLMRSFLENAVKFTPSGGTVSFSAEQSGMSSLGYSRFRFDIRDNGIGMSEEFLTRIFNPFSKEESATKSGKSGAGLGLAIAKRLLDGLGGSVSVESEKGKGSLFAVSIPLKLAGACDLSVKSDVMNPSVNAEAQDSSKRRILVVEDVEMNRILTERILTREGFLVESVEDGSDALSVFLDHEEGYYDLILMDIQMPVMNGYEATRRIRKSKRSDSSLIPIVALSANARDEDRRMSFECGMNAHIAKPFEIPHLLETINDLILQRVKKSADRS